MNQPEKIKTDRLKYENATYYTPRVLLGNWVEERVGNYKKNPHQHITLYKQDYTPKYPDDKKETDDLRNDISIKSESGFNMAPPRNDDDITNDHDNFTTTYDLSFQYFPAWIPGTINRKMRFRLLKYEPADEYLNSFGNLSSRNGLTDYLKEKWECDVLDPRRTTTSTAQSNFIPYDPEYYRQSRWPRLHPVKVKCGAATDILYKQLPPNHPRRMEAKLNPITWE